MKIWYNIISNDIIENKGGKYRNEKINGIYMLGYDFGKYRIIIFGRCRIYN